MSKKYEILAPAGNFEALYAAVQNGADAVYLSGKDFGARKFADNFSNEELVEAVNYCHIRDVKVYVTVNTLILNNEFEKLKKYMDFLYVTGIDAVIIQDIGILNYIRKNYKDLKIHCSTQMSDQTVEDIKYLEVLGADRVVLGREMTIDDIKRAKEETNIELEVFVHGALCISVSGQCFMSSMIGGRSGNRGSCAQPCRQKYTLYNMNEEKKHMSLQGDYLLSPKDLCTLDDIKTVIDAGAFSLKIEGRMKSPEYVAAVTRAYSIMLDKIFNKKNLDIKALEKELKIFNRGFTRGHLFEESGLNLMSLNSPSNQGYYLGKVVDYDRKLKKVTILLSADLNHNDEIQIRRRGGSIGGRVEKLECNEQVVKKCHKGQVCRVNFKHDCKPGEEIFKTYDEELMKKLKNSYNKEHLEIPVNAEVCIKKGSNIGCSLSDGKNTVVDKTDIIPQEALKKAITKDEVKNQMSKFGGTPYKLENIRIVLDEGLALPTKEINSIRRRLVDKLNEKRASKYDRETKLTNEIKIKPLEGVPKKIEFTYSVNNIYQLKKLIDIGADTIYYKDLETLDLALNEAKEKKFKGKIIPEIFRLILDEDLKKYKNLILDLKLDTVLIQSHGHINMFNEFNLIGDFNLNVVNNLSYRFYIDNNFDRISLSPELNLSQISSMDILPNKTEIIGYGYIPVMVMKHCVISTVLNKQKNCGLCYKNSYCLIDKMGEAFKIIRRYNCNTEIHNSKKFMLIDYYKSLESAGVGYFRFNFLDETPEEIEMVVDIHKKIISSSLMAEDYKIIDNIKKNGVTSGHINRGIE